MAGSLELLTIDCPKNALWGDCWNALDQFDPAKAVTLQHFSSLKELYVVKRFLEPPKMEDLEGLSAIQPGILPPSLESLTIFYPTFSMRPWLRQLVDKENKPIISLR